MPVGASSADAGASFIGEIISLIKKQVRRLGKEGGDYFALNPVPRNGPPDRENESCDLSPFYFISLA